MFPSNQTKKQKLQTICGCDNYPHCDAITGIYIASKPMKCQSKHFNTVNYTYSTRASYAQQKNLNLLSALNTLTKSVASFYYCARTTNPNYKLFKHECNKSISANSLCMDG